MGEIMIKVEEPSADKVTAIQPFYCHFLCPNKFWKMQKLWNILVMIQTVHLIECIRQKLLFKGSHLYSYNPGQKQLGRPSVIITWHHNFFNETAKNHYPLSNIPPFPIRCWWLRVLRGAKHQVLIRCQAERAKTRAGGCESRPGFVHIFIWMYARHWRWRNITSVYCIVSFHIFCFAILSRQWTWKYETFRLALDWLVGPLHNITMAQVNNNHQRPAFCAIWFASMNSIKVDLLSS